VPPQIRTKGKKKKKKKKKGGFGGFDLSQKTPKGEKTIPEDHNVGGKGGGERGANFRFFLKKVAGVKTFGKKKRS